MSLENVVCFPGVEPPVTEAEVKQDLVGFLTELTEKAAAGEIRSFYAVAFDNEGNANNLMSGDHESPLEVVGALDLFKDIYKTIVMQ
jgi:hypothetical protein